MRLFSCILFSTLAVALSADTLVLKSGPSLQGTYLGGDAHSVRFAVGDQTIRTYPVDRVASLSFGSSSSAPFSTAPKTGASSELPAGTTVVVRLIDAIDSRRDAVGQVYRASLDQPLAIDTAVVAPRGSDAVVELIDARPAAHTSGRAELSVTLKSVTIRNRIYPVQAQAVMKASSSHRGRRTAAMIGTGGGIGAIVGAIAGGGRGAAIGAGSGAAGGALAEVLIRGPRVRIPSESPSFAPFPAGLCSSIF